MKKEAQLEEMLISDEKFMQEFRDKMKDVFAKAATQHLDEIISLVKP